MKTFIIYYHSMHLFAECSRCYGGTKIEPTKSNIKTGTENQRENKTKANKIQNKVTREWKLN